ncbi:3-oxoacyl-ACP reductase [Chromatiales bacterium (ex Bugula neritina AB1)]|nr:3-oxoacyl-ACP reductase [Chromatiales bacterium (ex Bugula neritina AB1)]
MNSYDFTDRVAVVTGGCNGIGAAVVERLVQSGGRVIVWDMDLNSVEDRIKKLPGEQVTLVETDVTRVESVEAALAESERVCGRVDVLVNSAGIAGPNGPVSDYPVDEWRKVMAVNLDGTFHCCRTVVPGMTERGYGRIVNVASVAGKEGNPNASAYSASKAAVIALTKSLGKELSAHDIAVNCITPAAARTRIFEQMSQEHIDFMLSKIPRARFVTVEEIASMVLWMASAENSFTTGAAFDISGGRATY